MEKEQPLISVVIPSYNRATTICGSLKSVLEQTYQNLEVLVVDDGSDDDTENILSAYLDPRVKYLKYTPNKGACYARNYGANLAKGEYLAFQDSDDIWHKEKLKKQLCFLKQADADFVFCGIRRVSEKGRSYYYPVNGFDNQKDALEQFLYENRAGTQTMFMKKQVWETIRFDETFRRYQDWDFALRAASFYNVSFMEEALVDSAVGVSSISASVSSYPALCHLFDKHKNLYKKSPKALARMYRRMARRLYKENPKEAQNYYEKCLKIEAKGSDFAGMLICKARNKMG